MSSCSLVLSLSSTMAYLSISLHVDSPYYTLAFSARSILFLLIFVMPILSASSGENITPNLTVEQSVKSIAYGLRSFRSSNIFRTKARPKKRSGTHVRNRLRKYICLVIKSIDHHFCTILTTGIP